MIYNYIDPVLGKTFIEETRNGNSPLIDKIIKTRGKGELYQEKCIKALREDLIRLKEKYPTEIKQRDEKGGDFEAEACSLVHKHLIYNPAIFADHDFWLWMTLKYFADIIEWRHGGQDRQAALGNYGLGNRSENLIFRMWLRADIGYEKNSSDPYELAKRGNQDFWRSHILRQSYGNVRKLAKSLIKFQCLDNGSYTLKTKEIRELAKIIKRLRANIMFEFMDIANIDNIISYQASRLTLNNDT
jgi:hypothetical protein